jgi:excisionase family DNA binding protein
MLTRSQVCQRLGIGKNRFHELVKSGELRAIRTGSAPNSAYKVSEDALAEYIERSTVKPAVVAS